MNPTTSKIAVCCTLALGAGLWGGMAQKFNANDELSYEPNIACVKGSPYGKVLALAVQGPIDFYWHSGQTHADAQVLKDEQAEGGGCADGCTDHDHSHVAPAPAEHGDDCGCGAHDEAPAKPILAQAKPFQQRAKHHIRKMAATAHRRTDGTPLSSAHKEYLQGVTEDKLRLAYELDPSNYTNYGNYHMFIATTTFGRDEADDERAVELARKTLEFCKKDSVDPTSWLTAASAAYNIVFHIGRYYKEFTIPEAKASLAEFDFCIMHFERLSQQAVAEGRIASDARLKEMQARVQYLTKLRKAQGVYMKHVMTREMAARSNVSQTAN